MIPHSTFRKEFVLDWELVSNEFIYIKWPDRFIDRIEAIKYGWTEIISTALYIKEWLKQSKIPTLFFFAWIIIIIKVNFVKKVIFYFPRISLMIKYIVEVLYTDKRHVDFIPCLMEPSYKPHGWLGIIIRDQLYIDFSSPDNFDASFEELVAEIQAIEDRLPLSTGE